MDAELDEKLVHLADVGGVAVGVEKGRGRHGIANINGDDLGAAAGGELQNVNVFAVGERVKELKSSGIVCNYLVRRGVRREEGELRSHG